MTIFKFCFNWVFTFDGKVYNQVIGNTFGSTICGVSCPPNFWARFVDDTFVVKERLKNDMVRDQ